MLPFECGINSIFTLYVQAENGDGFRTAQVKIVNLTLYVDSIMAILPAFQDDHDRRLFAVR